MGDSTVYGLWICGAAGKRFRGYNGNPQHLRVSDEQHVRLAFLDAHDPQNTQPGNHRRPLKDILVSDHVMFAEHVVGLAFVARSSVVYRSCLDNLNPEQRVVLLGAHSLSVFSDSFQFVSR